MNNEQFPRTDADVSAEQASAQAWGEPVGEPSIVSTQTPEVGYPRTEGDAAAEYSADQAADQWEQAASSTEIPVVDASTGSSEVVIHTPTAAEIVGKTEGTMANPGELPAPVTEEPKTPELV